LNSEYRLPNGESGWIVAVLAPTGIAAYLINGQTIHRFFKLPVAHGDSDLYWKLSTSNVKFMRPLVKNLKLMIIGIFNIKN
jgi:hypothetical protein